MKILGTGLRGLVGSRIVELLKDNYEFDSSEADITNKNAISEKIKSSDAQVVLHLAAKTDVDGCEKDKEEDLGILGLKDFKKQEEEFKSQKTAWGVNVLGTRNIADVCSETNKRLIYISTDFIFDGVNPPVDGYSEDDIPNPINWYAKTKYEGEKIIKNSFLPWLIARIAYPYRAAFERLDFTRAILGKLRDGLTVAAVTDHIFTPTFIDDIAFALDALIKNNSQGIFHLVGSQSLTPYDAALLIAKNFNFDQGLIEKTIRIDYFRDRALRPFQLRLKNDKIQKSGIKMRTFEEGLRELHKQISNS